MRAESFAALTVESTHKRGAQLATKERKQNEQQRVPHPNRGLRTEAKIEREISDSPEAETLKEAIYKSVQAYSDFLDRQGLIWEFGHDPDDPDFPRLKAQALVVTLDYGRDFFDIWLKDGALDRVYGVNPDPDGFDAGPT